MKKILTKTLSLVLCIAFTGMQTSLAAVLTTGDFAGRQVLNGTGAVIKGHTAGLRAVETDLTNATLRFNNHTRIDWDKLNVDKGQKLYFNNGTYGVLNNVVGTSISKFAGSITADSGKIIISNPNGMLFQGGQFTSTGSLLLTTKNLTADAYGEGYNFNDLNIDNANNGSGTFQVIQLLKDADGNNTVITAGDISVISNGVQMNGADLTANGVVLVTADGANFVANKPNNNGYTVNADYAFENIANTAISSETGEITLKSGRGMYLNNVTTTGDTNLETATASNALAQNLTVNGDLDVKSSYLWVNNGSQRSKVTGDLTMTDTKADTYAMQATSMDVDGNVTVNAQGWVSLKDFKANTTEGTKTDITDTYYQVQLKDVELGDTNVTAENYFVRICGDNKIHGDLNVKSNSLNVGSYNNESHVIDHGSTTVDGEFNADIRSTIGFSDVIKADTITFTSAESSILNANEANGDGTLIANNINLSAKKGEITSVNADVNREIPQSSHIEADGTITYATDADGNVIMTPASDYFELMRGPVTLETLAGYDRDHVALQGGNANVEAKGAVALKADLTGDLDVKSDLGITILDSTIGGDATLTSDIVNVQGNAADDRTTIAGDLNIIDNVGGGRQGKYDVYVNNVEVGDELNLSTTGHLYMKNVKSGDADIKGYEIRMTNMDMGNTKVKTEKGFTRIAGENQFHGDLDVETFTLNLGSYTNDTHAIDKGSTTVEGDLTVKSQYNIGVSDDVVAKNIDMTAEGASIVSADGYGTITGTESVKLTSNDGSILSVDAEVPATGGNSDYVSMMTSYATTAKLATKKTGNVDVKGGTATVTATDNVGVNADLTGDLNVTGGAKLDAYANVSGNIGGNLNTSVDDTHIANATVGGNVLAIDSFDNPDDTKGVTITDSNITGTLTRPNNWDNVKVHGTTAGDTTLRGSYIEVKDSNVANLDTNTVNNIKLDNVAATGKVDAIAGKTADLDDVTAAGKLNVNAKDADVKTSKGAEVLVQGTNSVILNDVKATAGDLTARAENSLTVDKAVAIKTNDTNGNIYLGSNGTINSLTADTATADTDLTIEAAGNINVTGLKADADNNNIGDLTINGNNITAKVGEGANVTISAAGTATVEDITAKAGNADIQSNKKLTATNVTAVKTNANNGDVKLASNSDVEVTTATADKDIRVTGRDITASGLTADAENNTIGDVYVDGRNTTLTNSTGANVTEIASGKAAAKDVIAKSGNVDIRALADGATTANAENITANSGNVTVQANEKVTAKNLNATKSDETNGNIKVASRNSAVEFTTANAERNIEVIANNGAITASGLKADSEMNGVGDLIINGKSATVSTSEGANATLVGLDSLTINDVTAHAGNLDGRSNGIVTADTMKAVKTSDADGNIYLGSKTKVDAKNGDADTNITIASEGDAIAEAMKADFENNGIGDLTITGVNTTLKNSEGANVTESASNNAVADTVTAKAGNALIEATNTANADKVTANSGNVTVRANNAVVASNLTATKSDENNGNIYVTSSNADATLTTANAERNVEVRANKGTATGSGLKADTENNANGDVIISGKKAVLSDSEGANVTVRATETTADLTNVKAKAGDIDAQSVGNITATNVTAVKTDDTNGNVKLATNANANVTKATADTNVEITANAGNVIADQLKADAEDNTIGDIIINTKNATLTNSEGANVKVNATETASLDTVTAKAGDIDAKSNGNLVGNKLTAKKTNEENGNIKLGSNANVTVADAEAERNIEVTANLGKINAGKLTADTEENGNGSVILTGKTVSGLNDAIIGSTGRIKGANVTINQSTPVDTYTATNLVALGKDDNNGDVNVNVPVKNIILEDISATRDVTVDNRPADANGILETATLTNVFADSEENGVGEINIKTRGVINANNIAGANITLESINDNITVNGAKSVRADQPDTAGNVKLIADSGNISVGNVNAATDIIGTALNGNIDVTGNLTADYEPNTALGGNGVGDVILTAKKLDGDNFKLTDSQIAIKGADVILNQSTPQDTLVLSNITADGKGHDNVGDVLINIPVKNVDLNNIHATRDIVVDNGTTDGILDSAKLTTVIADSEENGIGDLYIKTRDDINATDIGGANITLESTNGNITVDGAKSARGDQADADAGNITIIAHNNGNADDKGNITLGNIHADTDVVGDASKGNINQTGDIVADNEGNGVGEVRLTAKDGITLGDNGVVKGADITIEVGNGDIDVKNLIADGQVYDENGNVVGNSDDHGNISIHTPNGNVTVDDTTGTHDVTIVTDNGKANVTDTSADSERNGQGTLTIKATDDVVASNDDGANVVIETKGDIDADDLEAHAPGAGEEGQGNGNGNIILTSEEGNIDLDGAKADHDIVITPGKDADGKYIGDANVNDAHADADNDKDGDLIINGKNVTVDAEVAEDQDGNKTVTPTGDTTTGNNVIINADNDVVAEDINSNDDIIITAGNDVIGDNLIADAENPNTADSDGIGDLIINAGGDVDLNNGEGANVDITAGDDVNATDITAHGNDGTPDNPQDSGDITINAGGDVNVEDTNSVKDTEITAGGDITVTNATADTDNDTQGDLIIHGKGDVTVDGGDGANVEITSDNGDVDIDDVHAHGTDDGDDTDPTIGQGSGNIIIDAPNGDVTIDNSDANNDIVITVGGGDVIVGPNVIPDKEGNDVGRLIIDKNPGGGNGFDTGDDLVSSEIIKHLNNLNQSGVDTVITQQFTPIAFAADDEDEQSAIAKRIAKTVFKTPETGIVTITERYKSMR